MPSPVDRYFKDVKKKNPSYSEEQAWATAWSIYCKHKNPGSDSSCCCSLPESLRRGMFLRGRLWRGLPGWGTHFARTGHRYGHCLY